MTSSCLFFPLECRQLRTDWWPADTGQNQNWLSEFQRWAFEDPTNNLSRHPLTVTYREADLQVTQLTVPTTAASGEVVSVSFVVANQGTRETRQSSWKDRVFLSRDPSLDRHDLLLGEVTRQGSLAAGESYQASLDVRLPDSIDGPSTCWSIPMLPQTRIAKSTAISVWDCRAFASRMDATLGIFDLVSSAQRSLRRGRVAEYQQEGNNTAVAQVDVEYVEAPDLRVTQVIAPDRVTAGQVFDVTYTVSNLGGKTADTQSTWDDLLYFSRDPLA